MCTPQGLSQVPLAEHFLSDSCNTLEGRAPTSWEHRRHVPERWGIARPAAKGGRRIREQDINDHVTSNRFLKDKSDFFFFVGLEDSAASATTPTPASEDTTMHEASASLATPARSASSSTSSSDESDSDDGTASASPPSKAKSRVLIVVEVKHKLGRKTMKHIRDTFRRPQRHDSKRLSRKRRRRTANCFAVLEQLGHQMLKSNAPLGVVYTGNDVLVFERRLKHDEDQIDLLAEQPGQCKQPLRKLRANIWIPFRTYRKRISTSPALESTVIGLGHSTMFFTGSSSGYYK